MKNNYDSFFKSARAKKMQSSELKKIDLSKLRKNSTSNGLDLKSDFSKIHKKLSQKRQQKLKRQFPVSAALGLFLALIGAVVVGYNSDKMEEVLSTIEIKILGAASAESGAQSSAKSAEAKVKKEESISSKGSEERTPEKEKLTSLTPEELALFKSLDDRRKSLDQKEAELKKMEEELQKQREELDKRLVDIEQVRKTIANQLEEKVKVDEERVDQLVSFYSSMKAQQAAKIIEALNEDLAIEVLLKMKKKSAAEIMNLMAAEKAQRLSEKFAGYRRK